MLDAQTILQNVKNIQAEIAVNARNPERLPKLLPVTKTQSIEAIQALSNAGIHEIGENRVQEIMAKHPTLSGDFSFHLVGQLQTNKIKYIMGKVCMVQSVDRMSLAEALNKKAEALQMRMPVLIEVNVGMEKQKAGIDFSDLEPFARALATLEGIQVCGMMTVMPQAKDPQTLRPLFVKMRHAFEHLKELAIDRTKITELSMGMSGDWKIAAQEGSTMLRIGSAIFGEREPLAMYPAEGGRG